MCADASFALNSVETCGLLTPHRLALTAVLDIAAEKGSAKRILANFTFLASCQELQQADQRRASTDVYRGVKPTLKPEPFPCTVTARLQPRSFPLTSKRRAMERRRRYAVRSGGKRSRLNIWGRACAAANKTTDRQSAESARHRIHCHCSHEYPEISSHQRTPHPSTRGIGVRLVELAEGEALAAQDD